MADVAGPGERHEQHRGALDPRGERRPQLRGDARVVQRVGPRGGRDVRDRRGVRRRAVDDVDRVRGQRPARLGGEQRQQLVVAAGRQGRLGEATQRGVRDMRSRGRCSSQRDDSLRPKRPRLRIGPAAAVLDARPG